MYYKKNALTCTYCEYKFKCENVKLGREQDVTKRLCLPAKSSLVLSWYWSAKHTYK